MMLPVSTTAMSEYETRISSQQSLCLVKIFLNASLGCICFVRGLLPSNSPAYRDRQVDELVLTCADSRNLSYEEFTSLAGRLRENGESQQFKLLAGGKDKRADVLLELVVCSSSYS